MSIDTLTAYLVVMRCYYACCLLQLSLGLGYLAYFEPATFFYEGAQSRVRSPTFGALNKNVRFVDLP